MISRCPSCGGARHSRVLELGCLPAAIHVLLDTREKALEAPLGNIVLVRCDSCGLLYNREFCKAKVVYAPGYENALNYSETYRQFAQDRARWLVERFDIRHRTVVEIGCGNGFFLRLICQIGENCGFGIDPSAGADPDSSWPTAFGEAVIAPGTWEGWRGPGQADLVCCRHVLEHVDDPSRLVDTLCDIAKQSGIVYIEVPNAASMLSMGVPWDCLYEHVTYFDIESLYRLVVDHDLPVFSLEECFNGQYLCLTSNPSRHGNARPRGPLPDLKTSLEQFGDSCLRTLELWNHRLEAFREDDIDVVLWGAGSKGMVFLNLVERSSAISRVVDLNPSKQGKFVPGTAHVVVAPDALVEFPPDVVVIANRVYAPEISTMLGELGLFPRLIFL